MQLYVSITFRQNQHRNAVFAESGHRQRMNNARKSQEKNWIKGKSNGILLEI
jgi:hypothetical protein